MATWLKRGADAGTRAENDRKVRDTFEAIPWMIKLSPNTQNQLAKVSSADAFQIKNLSVKRFDKKIGEISEETLFKIHSTITKTLKINYKLSQ